MSISDVLKSDPTTSCQLASYFSEGSRKQKTWRGKMVRAENRQVPPKKFIFYRAPPYPYETSATRTLVV